MDSVASDYLKFDRESVAAEVAKDGGMPTEVVEVTKPSRYRGLRHTGRNVIPRKEFKPEDFNDDQLFNDQEWPKALAIYKKEKPSHRMIAYLKAQNYSGREIAEMVGLTPATVYTILALPWVKTAILETIKEFGRDAVQETLASEALDSIQFLVEIRNDGKAPTRDRITAAKELLDRTFGKPNQPITHREETDLENLTDEQLAKVISGGVRGN